MHATQPNSLTVSTGATLQVDRILPFTPLGVEDIQQVFRLLLTAEQEQRRRRRYQPARPRHERLPLRWDDAALAALANDATLGGFSARYARLGASKCEQALQYQLFRLSRHECPSDSYAYELSGSKQRDALLVSCVALPSAKEEL